MPRLRKWMCIICWEQQTQRLRSNFLQSTIETEATIYGSWLINDVCFLGQLGSIGARDTIPCKTLLKISVETLSSLCHEMLFILFNKFIAKYSARDIQKQRQTDTDRLQRGQSIETTDLWKTREKNWRTCLGFLLIKLSQEEFFLFHSLMWHQHIWCPWGSP